VFRRLSALIWKETIQTFRDRRTLMLTVMLPMIELFLFAYAVTLTVDHLPTALVDQSCDEQSRAFVQALVNSTYFDIRLEAQNEQEVIAAIDAGTVKAGVIIPPDFSREMARGQARALVLLDGSDSFSVSSGYNAASAIAQKYAVTLASQKVTGASGAGSPVRMSERVLYNPDTDDLTFILPGLIALLVQNVIMAQAAVAVVRERELGTMEQLLATPIRPIEMLIAKLIPGLIVILGDAAIVLGLGVFWFKVPFRGDLGTFSVLMVVFIIAGMGLGLLISTLTHSQRQAQQVSIILMVFTMLLTGFIYPRTSMPAWCQAVGNLIPLTYFVRIARGVITKGVGLDVLWNDALALVAFAVVTFGLAAVLFKKRLD
jgi:ABC-2 type transport system permease protein